MHCMFGQGDYDPTQTKVFHFTMNPSDQAQSKRKTELIKLQEENARLSARVQLLEESGGKVEDLTIQVEQKLESIPESKMIEGQSLSQSASYNPFSLRTICLQNLIA